MTDRSAALGKPLHEVRKGAPREGGARTPEIWSYEAVVRLRGGTTATISTLRLFGLLEARNGEEALKVLARIAVEAARARTMLFLGFERIELI